MRAKRLITFILLAVIAIPAAPFVYGNERDREVKVAAYNMYPGTEFSGIFLAQTPDELVAEVAEAYNDVNASNVPERIDEIADQIATNQPYLVGLQEVAIWSVGAPFDPADANFVVYDFLQILLDRLAARGAHYEAISIQENLTAELPAVFSQTSALDVRFTDRVVILARTDMSTSEIKIEGVDAGTFASLLTLPSPTLGNVVVPRGWTSADIKHRGKTYRFVNAHLESFVEYFQILQAQEVVDGPANTDLPVIVAGDYNSDPGVNPTAYNILLGSGLSDAWTSTNPGSPGFTWALSGELPSVILQPDQRVDLVLFRGGMTASSSDLIGEEVGDITPSGFRPSDHAGVVASFVLHP
ncbi:MAG: endonuclease/exonuclease/phosphatase family protein [bacterium]|nr:endonuclease/exonuclease/phosphatase family protein [bacterium]